ncbi:MAG: putative lipopolysaccharide heptosyltransferase III [Deltaproteobacteria bacterium]|nr:putative lipopolysaccharide heptosyltransferase III [Deltaproteobacteria bacterium]
MHIIDKSTYKLPKGIQKILLIQLGDIGDVVWTTPSIWAVKNSIPDSKVSILVKDGFGGILEADPSINRIFEVKKYQGDIFDKALVQWSFLKHLRNFRFDLVVDLRLGDRGAFMSFATGAPLRVTMYHSEDVPFWRNLFFTHAAKVSAPIHKRGAADQSLCILRELGIDTANIVPKLWVTDSTRCRVQDILTQKQVNQPQDWITINPYSRWQYKEWSDGKWIEIINWLWEEFTIPTIIIGSLEERAKAEAIIQKCKARAFNLAGETTLEELAGLLSLSRLHIGVDSAGPHIAAATGTPTITIYGPSDWKDWAPLGKNHRVISPDLDCAPCHQKGCDNTGRSRCLEEMTVDQVMCVIREAIEEQS